MQALGDNLQKLCLVYSLLTRRHLTILVFMTGRVFLSIIKPYEYNIASQAIYVRQYKKYKVDLLTVSFFSRVELTFLPVGQACKKL